MVYRAIRICSSFEIMHDEFNYIRDITLKDGYPSNFVECQIRHTLNRYFQSKDQTPTTDPTEQVPPKTSDKDQTSRIVIDVPYVGQATKRFVSDIKRLAYKVKPKTEIRAIPRPPPKIGHWFRNKDEIPKYMQSNVVYQLNCSSCPATYIGKTIRQVGRRLEEHGAPTPTPTPTVPPEALRRSARIAAAKKIAKLNVDSDSSEDWNRVPPVSTKNRGHAEVTSAVHRHIKETKHNIDWVNWTVCRQAHYPCMICHPCEMTLLRKIILV